MTYDKQMIGRLGFVFACALVATVPCLAQARDCIVTQESTLCVRDLNDIPTLTELRTKAAKIWSNVRSEKLMGNVVVAGVQRPLRWHFSKAESRSMRTRVTYVYISSSPKLRLTWEWEARASSGPIEHRIRVENLEAFTVTLPLQESIALQLRPPSPEPKLEQMLVEKGADTPSPEGTHRVKLSPGEKWSGYSSTYAHPVPGMPREIIPWTLVRDETSASGFYLGAEFSGRLTLTVNALREQVAASVGLNASPGPFQFDLSPGESFETPTVFIAAFDGDADDAGNVLRRWVRNVLGSPTTWADDHYPYLTNNSWGSGTAIDEHVAERMIQDSKSLGLEMFHLDAGWFRAVGDWTPDPKKFPHGLAPIAENAHRAGLKFGLWMDWAQAGTSDAPGALNVHDPKVHDWLVTDLPDDWKPEEFKGQTIDIGVPEAAHWVRDELDRVASDFHLDMLEHDGYVVTQGCVRKDHPHRPPSPSDLLIQQDAGFRFAFSSNSTEVSYRATRSYYALYEQLRRTHPNLLLEICNDGGRMVDFGSAAHGDYFSITDTYDPLSNRRAFYDASWVLPPAMLESYVEKWPVSTLDNFRYMLRSGMMGWFSVMQDTNAWSAEQHRAAQAEIALYKSKLRALIRDANLYHVSDRPDGIGWDAEEYASVDQKRGVVFVFRGSGSEQEHVFHLQGLASSARYRIHWQDGTSPDTERTGRALMDSGLRVELPNANSSELVFLDEKQF